MSEGDFKIDEKIDYARIEQFASQVDHLPTKLREGIEKDFDGSHSMEFYHGLIAGLAAAYTVSGNEEYIKKNYVNGAIGAMLSVVSNEFKKRIE